MASPQNKPPRARARRWLLIRFGGQGDALFLTPVAEELKRRGWEVHVAVNDMGYPLLRHLPFIDKLYLLRRDPVMQETPGISGHPCDLMEWQGALLPVEAVYKHFPGPGPEYGPWAVTNYRYVIESNSIHPWINRGQNSTGINTYDTHFSWAGIDPQTVPPEHRRPRYVVTSQEREAIREAIRGLPRPIYLVQALASSPARSYHRLRELYTAMIGATRGSVLFWNGGNWETRSAPFPLPVVVESTPMRMSAALVGEADYTITADTALSHIAEALSRPHMAFYSTVPAWTRARDYLFETSINIRVPDSRGRSDCKCGVIGRDCPRISQEAYEGLNDRQRDLLRLMPPEQQMQLGIPPSHLDTGGRMPNEYFETTPAGMQAEHEAAVRMLEGLRQKPAYCIAALDLWEHVKKAMAEVEAKHGK